MYSGWNVTGTKTHTDQRKRIESPEAHPHFHGQSMTKEARIYKREKIVFLINIAGKTRELHAKG